MPKCVTYVSGIFRNLCVEKGMRLRGHLSKLDLLVLDELGYVPASKVEAELLFDIISKIWTQEEKTDNLVSSVALFDRRARAHLLDSVKFGSKDGEYLPAPHNNKMASNKSDYSLILINLRFAN